MRVTVADENLDWTGPLSTAINVSVGDPYGRVLTGSYELAISFNTGNGVLTYGKSSSGSASITYT